MQKHYISLFSLLFIKPISYKSFFAYLWTIIDNVYEAVRRSYPLKREMVGVADRKSIKTAPELMIRLISDINEIAASNLDMTFYDVIHFFIYQIDVHFMVIFRYTIGIYILRKFFHNNPIMQGSFSVDDFQRLK